MGAHLNAMRNFVRISVAHIQLVLSPAYDMVHTAEELRLTNLEKLQGLET